MARVLFVLALLAFAVSAWVWTAMKNSYSPYTDAQLDAFEQQLRPVAAQRDFNGDEAKVSLALIRDERSRRELRFMVPIVGIVLFSLAVFFALKSPPREGKAKLSPEEARLQALVGNPEHLAAGARARAAAVLGVSVDAPPAVVEAAYEANVRMQDPSRLSGLAPEIRESIAWKLKELERARDLLLSRES